MSSDASDIAITTPFYCHDGKGRFLFGKRSKQVKDEQGRWDPGAGLLEDGLTPEESVLRLVLKTYGCVGSITGSLPAHSLIHAKDGHEKRLLVVPFFVQVDPSEVRIAEPRAIDEIAWHRLGNLPSPLHTGFMFSIKHYKEFFVRYYDF